MSGVAAPTGALHAPDAFVLAADRSASVPPEARGVPRDGVRLLVASDGAVRHARFRDLPRFFRRGDLLVVNDSATLPAAIDGRREDGRAVTVHFSTRLDDGSWAVEVRPPGRATGPVHDARAGERLPLRGGVALELLEGWPDPWDGDGRLWRVRTGGPTDVPTALRRHGRPIAYAYVEGRWPLEAYQTVFARHPGSAEMPSAARPFTPALLGALDEAGVGVAALTLHTGVSSLESGEGPLPERFVVPRTTAERVQATRRGGGRVVAVGTTVTRALETVADAEGIVRPGAGWTGLVLGTERPARVVDGIVTGWHAPGASHLRLLRAVAGEDVVRRAYAEALAGPYLWHEFGDAALLFGDRPRRRGPVRSLTPPAEPPRPVPPAPPDPPHPAA